MTIKEEYNRAYRNYLRRVNRAVKQGYVVETVNRVKRPTRASIRRIKKLTGEYIRQHSGLVNMTTGEILLPIKNRKKRRSIQKKNMELLSMPLRAISDAVEMGVAGSQEVSMSDDILSLDNSYEQIIANWYEQVRTNFYWYIAQFIEWRTNELIEGKPAETRRRFAYVLTQNPDVFPEPPYLSRDAVNDSFNEIARLMELAPDSEAYQDFASMYDFIEPERFAGVITNG